MLTTDFSCDYPPELIAKYPLEQRDESRLLVLDRSQKSWQHRRFKNIVEYFKPGDVLVFNNTKVFPCRLITQRKSGGRQEIFLLNSLSPRGRGLGRGGISECWQVLLNASGKVKCGDKFEFDGLTVTINENEGNLRTARLDYTGDLFTILNRVAHMPLPPYINRDDEILDHERYQTVFAKDTGSVAAPTAGLHFTDELIGELKNKGVIIAEVTLHVGLGTFLPVKVADIRDHKMHSEFFSVSQEACDVLNLAKREGRSITAVGTTAARVLETMAQRVGTQQTGAINCAPTCGETNIFIYPPYEFKMVDRLITNFHQPESTLLMLVSAFAGREFVLSAYAEAIREKYRLFSYGDAMMIHA